MTDLILLNYNDCDSCIEFIQRHKNRASIDHFIVVDNNSSDNSFDRLLRLSSERIIIIKTDCNKGYASGNNYGIAFSKEHFDPDFIVVSNPDVAFDDDCVFQCISTLESNPEYIVSAPRMKNREGSCQPCAWNLASWFRYAWEMLPFTKKKRTITNSQYDEKEFVECDCVAGSFFVISIKKITRTTLFDPHTFLYCEETILGFLNGRNKAVSLSNTFFVHAHNQSISKTFKSSISREKLIWKSKKYVFKKYYKIGVLKRMIVTMIKLVDIFLTAIRSLIK